MGLKDVGTIELEVGELRKIIIGSRRSQLALTQTEWVISKLKEAGAPFDFEIKKIITKGDQILDVTLSKVGGKGYLLRRSNRRWRTKKSISPFTV